jgi:hypothetical protein
VNACQLIGFHCCIAPPKLLGRIAPTAMELVLLDRLFGECRNLLFGLSLFLRKGHPFPNDFSARLVVFHVRDSLGYLIL